MNEYQHIYNKAKEELKELESELKEKRLKKDEAKTEYNDIKSKLEKQEISMDSLKNKKSSLLNKQDKKISIITKLYSASATILYFGTVIILLASSLIISKPLPHPALFLIPSSLVIGVVTAKTIDKYISLVVKIHNKIIKKIEQKHFNKISKTEEYQNILTQIKTLEEKLEITKKEAKTKESFYKEVEKEYTSVTQEIITQQKLINALEWILSDKNKTTSTEFGTKSGFSKKTLSKTPTTQDKQL